MRYLRKYERLPATVAQDLLERLRKEPLYENTTAEIIAALDQRVPRRLHGQMIRVMNRLWRRRSLGPELRAALGRPIFRERSIPERRIRYALLTLSDWWVREELFEVLTLESFGTVFLGNVLNSGIRDAVGDVALSAAERVAYLGLNVLRPLNELNMASARALRQLGIISRLPTGVDGIERSLSRLIGKATAVNWRVVFRRGYKHAEKQAVFCRALGETDATGFVNAADVFNDLLLDRLYKHDPTLGSYTLGQIGSILTSVRLRNAYPAIFALVSEIHDQRYISSLSHAIARRTGKPTGRIRFKYMKKAKKLMRNAFGELSNKW